MSKSKQSATLNYKSSTQLMEEIMRIMQELKETQLISHTITAPSEEEMKNGHTPKSYKDKI